MKTIERIEDYIDEAIETALNEYDEINSDVLHEIADGSVPVYHHQLLELAMNDTSLATDEPELGPAYDGTPTPINIIAANIFERIYNALCEEFAEEL